VDALTRGIIVACYRARELPKQAAL